MVYRHSTQRAPASPGPAPRNPEPRRLIFLFILTGTCDTVNTIMKKICFVIPYFGKWPRWFLIFLETCRYNPTVNWLFFTDCRAPRRAPNNVRFVKTNLKETVKRTARRLNLPVAIDDPYKLTDFKPAYGVIFGDDLQEFDFWGHTDIDVIWGDIRKFLSEDVLAEYDVISGRKEFMTGHFALFRNREDINRLYEKSPDFRKIFSSDEHFAFTECGYNADQRPVCFSTLKGADVLDCVSEIESMSHVVKRAAKAGHVKALFTDLVFERHEIMKQRGWYLFWNKGLLREKESAKEYMYFHFHMFKDTINFFIPRWNVIPPVFMIGPKGFFTEEMLRPGYWRRMRWLDTLEYFFRSGLPALVCRLIYVLILRWWVTTFDRD